MVNQELSYVLPSNSHNFSEIKLVPTLQMGKLRCRDVGHLTEVTYLVSDFEPRSTWLHKPGLPLLDHAVQPTSDLGLL